MSRCTNSSCSCFGSAMGTEASKVVSLWTSFKRRTQQKNKKQSSKPAAFSNNAVEISPTRLIRGESKALVRTVSNSQSGESSPVILSPVGKAISNERQPTKKKRQLGFDAADIKVKSCNADISVKSHEAEVCTEELPPKQISEEDQVAVKKSYRRSWVRIAKAFQFPKAPERNGPTISQEVADSISRPIEQPSKSSLTSPAVDSKSNKLFTFITFHRKVSSQASKHWGIKSNPLSQRPRTDMNNTTANSQPKKPNMSAQRKGIITDEGEGYNMAIKLCVLIIIMSWLVGFSSRLLAVVCTSIWWYLLPSLPKKYR